nr:MAG TPA: hypothetical protein [Caudoviricetes sp.]
MHNRCNHGPVVLPRALPGGCTYICPSVSHRASPTCAYKMIYLGPWSQFSLERCRH